jgi:hypothetical protein
MKRVLAILLPLAFASTFACAPLSARAGAPETVHVTYHVKPGKLDEFVTALKAHYPACRKLGLVLDQPHLILSGKEDGDKPWVVEVLTWRDGDAPDSVSAKYPEVQAIWDRLNALVEKRDGRSAIEVEQAEVVAGGAPD